MSEQRIPIVAGNWKMNTNMAEARALAAEVARRCIELRAVDIVLCPPFVSLGVVAETIAGSRLALGAQNMHWEDRGAFTGEVAPPMLRGLCRHVIVGHSERRALFGETDEVVQRKVQAAFRHGLEPIVCVGENLSQYEAGQTNAVVAGQVRAAVHGLTAEQAGRLVLAYEPVWAIGSGRAATGAGANAVCGLVIRGVLADAFGTAVAERVRVQYGGSVTAGNAAEILGQPDIDGALVGGAALKADSFVAIVRAAANYRVRHRATT